MTSPPEADSPVVETTGYLCKVGLRRLSKPAQADFAELPVRLRRTGRLAVEISTGPGDQGRSIMLAAILKAPGHIVCEEVPDPEPGPEDALVAVKAVGICGTDMEVFRGELSSQSPITPGHDFAGEVVRVGTAVVDLAPGDRITAPSGWSCGQCPSCRRGSNDRCLSRRTLGRTAPGAFAQLLCLPARAAVPLPDSIPFRLGQAFTPLACCVRAVRRSGIKMGDKVAIIGPGHTGLLLLQLVLRAGAPGVTVYGTREERLALARRLGASETVHVVPGEGDLSSREGDFDLVVEASGDPSALSMAVRLAGHGATVVVFGVCQRPVPHFPGAEIYRKELLVVGSHGGRGAYDMSLNLLASRAIEVDELITHRMPLSRAPEAFEMVERREPGLLRAVIEP